MKWTKRALSDFYSHIPPALIVLIMLLSLVRLFHLEADFPSNITPCTVLYTDEGWYANNALVYFLTGHWHVPHDINFAVSLPVLQLVYIPFFLLLGPTMLAVRLTVVVFFFFSLILMYKILHLYVPTRPALLGILFASANHYWFAYSRLAIGELPMGTFILLSLWLLLCYVLRGKSWLYLVGASVAFTLAFFTKTSALFFLPGFLVILWVYRENRHTFFKQSGIFAGLWLAGILLHFVLIALPYYQDYLNFHAMNIGMELQFSPAFLFDNFRYVLRRARHMDRLVLPVLFIFAVFFAAKDKILRSNPLFLFSAVSFICTIGGLTLYEANRPRYYVPLYPVFAFALVLLLFYLWKKGWKAALILLSGVFIISFVGNVGRTVHYLATPSYSFREMAYDIQGRFEEEVDTRPAILGGMSSNIALYTGVFPVNDWFKVFCYGLYHPRYYVSLGPIEEEYLLVLNQYADVWFVRTYSVFDNYTDHVAFMYRLKYPEEKKSSSFIEQE